MPISGIVPTIRAMTRILEDERSTTDQKLEAAKILSSLHLASKKPKPRKSGKNKGRISPLLR